MNKFCITCQHRNVPAILKEKYNKHIGTMFVECPMNDEKVIGCFVANYSIKWKEFYEWLKENKFLTKKEIKDLDEVI